MRYKLLGNSGLRVSELCLGAMTFGEEYNWGASREESKKVFDSYAEAGGNFIDTANFYTSGTSEKFVGEFVGSERGRFVIATKYTMSTHPGDPNAGGNQRKNLVQSLEESLQRLNTDYIDLLWVHAWDPLTPLEETMRALDDIVRSGKALYVGISNAPAWVIAQANTMAELKSWTQFIGLQIEHSLVERTVERELLPMAKALNIGVTAWSPLAGGLLTGKYTTDTSESESGRLKSQKSQKLSEGNLGIARTLDEVAREIGCTAGQAGLTWVRAKGIIPIFGARTAAQAEENLACLKVSLSDEQLNRLDEVSRIELGFPHDFLGSERVQGFIYGGMRNQIDS